MKNLIASLLLAIVLFQSCSKDENCEAPTSIGHNNVDETYANITARLPKRPTTIIYEYGEYPLELGRGKRVTITYGNEGIGFLPYSGYGIRNLKTDTRYQYYIAYQCENGNTSDFTGPQSFTTIPFGEGCTKPREIEVLETGSDEISLRWNGFDESRWVVWYNEPNDARIEVEVDTTYYKIEGLLPNTRYEIVLALPCSNTGFPIITDPIEVTTLE